MNQIPYRKPQLGRDYWIKERVLPNAKEVAERCLSSEDWVLGHPYASQAWPGKRSASGADSMPRQAMTYWVSIRSPASVVTSQRWVSSL